MHLKRLELNGFKSFAKKSEFVFDVPIIAIVGPNGSGKSNVVEAIRFVLGEQSTKSMRAKTGSDLIFKGSKDIPKMSRANVSIVFNNTDRVFHLHHHNNEKVNVDFDEITITREVFSDGANSYRINGHEVRMKDVHELIASVNIGSSGHHIISQGEADRYLNANVRDRRSLIEEALGLKVYQYRLKESQRKLQKSRDNMRESELLRRELAPHLRFLKKQVEKLEKAKKLSVELQEKYQDYFTREDALIQRLSTKLHDDQNTLDQEYTQVQAFLDTHDTAAQVQAYPEEQEINRLEEELQTLSSEILEKRQELGRLEGMMGVLEKQAKKSTAPEQQSFSFTKVSVFVKDIIAKIDRFDFSSVDSLRSELNNIQNALKHFIQSDATEVTGDDVSDELVGLQKQRDEIHMHIQQSTEKQSQIAQQMSSLKKSILEKQAIFQESQKSYYEKIAYKKELDGKRALLESRRSSLEIRIQSRDEEYREACVLLGQRDITIQGVDLVGEINAELQEQSRRNIERIKIRLEDIGGGSGSELIHEYEETMERDNFLEKEITDLQTTIQSLEDIITDLKNVLNTEFDQGIEKINEEFGRFFRLMFGGGQAKLSAVEIKKRKKKSDLDEDMDEDEEDTEAQEYGIDIKVQLPRKKVSDLDMLSGGERSLTSIALLFALSQVNPPPFLVLDETDAALDEANSQRYGDMVEQLSKFSQLIVVTHNRETMSRAQTLFGVTLGRDDSSTTLSLRLEDASQYAK